MSNPIYNKDDGTITGVTDGGFIIVEIQIKKTGKDGDAKYELINQSVYYSKTKQSTNNATKQSTNNATSNLLIKNLIDDVK